jgi:hypothetical protein
MVVLFSYYIWKDQTFLMLLFRGQRFPPLPGTEAKKQKKLYILIDF